MTSGSVHRLRKEKKRDVWLGKEIHGLEKENTVDKKRVS